MNTHAPTPDSSTPLDAFRLRLGKDELVPIVIGGMGVDISTTELALEAARLGGIGHLSDAMMPTVCDRRYGTHYVRSKLQRFKHNVHNLDKTVVQFDLDEIAAATRAHVAQAMERKCGTGMVFLNCMEKLTMNSPRETLRARLIAALDAGIDGITLAAGLHLGTLALIEDHPRFQEVKLGIIVSSLRALQIFLRKNAKSRRLPDYVVVEGPLAGGHLGFGADWAQYNLATIVAEIRAWLDAENLAIPLIAAGGVFTGTDAVGMIAQGASAVQVATRFTVTHECGLPDEVKQHYFAAEEADIEVNTLSPTGYPMRMLKSSPCIGAGVHPNCEAYGYLLDGKGHCPYIDAWAREMEAHPEHRRPTVRDKTCLCTHMRNFDCWTCGQTTWRLKDTSHRNADGSYQLLSAEHVFRDYQHSTEGRIALPEKAPAA